jgi:hypothetical protein
MDEIALIIVSIIVAVFIWWLVNRRRKSETDGEVPPGCVSIGTFAQTQFVPMLNTINELLALKGPVNITTSIPLVGNVGITSPSPIQLETSTDPTNPNAFQVNPTLSYTCPGTTIPTQITSMATFYVRPATFNLLAPVQFQQFNFRGTFVTTLTGMGSGIKIQSTKLTNVNLTGVPNTPDTTGAAGFLALVTAGGLLDFNNQIVAAINNLI